MIEQSLIIVKPDGVERGLIGEIIRRLERTGLKIVAAKMLQVPKELADMHYPDDREELWTGIGQKSLDNYKAMGLDPVKEIGSNDPKAIGSKVRDWLKKYITEGPVFAFVIEGPHAVEIVRQFVGHTLPVNAAPGTIRGDFSFDSSALANSAGRPIRNIVHASGNLDEAKHEVVLWFKPEEMVNYKRVEEAAMMGRG